MGNRNRQQSSPASRTPLRSPSGSPRLPRPGGMLAWVIFLAVLFASIPQARTEELFPLYPSIRPNVRFWEDIYARYSTRQGVLHDQENLDIIYGVVDLVDWNEPGSAHINQQLIKLARQHYKSILSGLAAGKTPETDDEKRIAAMFPGKSAYAYTHALDNIRLQIGQKDRFLEGVIRSGAYLPYIRQVLISHNLPPELAYLPHVESSFNPGAKSKAGAVGLWQFTRGTGSQYMTVNDIVDERCDPFFSTRAAAVFLKENYAALKTWPLAITAYNYGRGGMIRAVKEKGGYENIFNNHRTGIFKFAARNFYPEFLAAMNVAKRLENDPRLIADRPEATVMLRLEGYARAADIMSHFRVAEEDFSRLNPSLLRPVLSGRKFIPRGFSVRLPAIAAVRERVASLPGSIYQPHQVRDNEYIVRRGDTAGSIARKHKISVNALILANGLDKRATIRIGQKLKIPGNTVPAGTIKVVELQKKSKTRPN